MMKDSYDLDMAKKIDRALKNKRKQNLTWFKDWSYQK